MESELPLYLLVLASDSSPKLVPTFGSDALDASFQKVVHSGPTEETEVTTLQIRRRTRMNIHKNARLTPLRREEMALAATSAR